MKVYVAGSFITIKDIQRVVDLQNALRKEGLNVLNQLEPFKWDKLYDFRNELDLARRIIKYDLSLLKKADVIVALANKPSFGTGAEVIYAKRVLRKKVVAIVTKPMRSPWILIHADVVVDSFDAKKIAEAIRSL